MASTGKTRLKPSLVSSLAEPVARLVQELNKLPGIGPKAAQRLAYFLMKAPGDDVRCLAEAMLAVKEKVSLCLVCFNTADSDLCPVCRDETRERSRICIVEEPSDILPLERTKKYKGLYHVLHGALAPTAGVGPDQLKIKELFERFHDGTVTEVIVATNPNLEGEATSLYLQQVISPTGIRVTRLARGLPFGSDLEYADDMTLAQALEGRQEI